LTQSAYLGGHHELVEPLASQAVAHERPRVDAARANQVWTRSLIARNRLDVRLVTVKSHVTCVLAKLGGTGYEAAERARALGLGSG
jgi:hypothetical protein